MAEQKSDDGFSSAVTPDVPTDAVFSDVVTSPEAEDEGNEASVSNVDDGADAMSDEVAWHVPAHTPASATTPQRRTAPPADVTTHPLITLALLLLTGLAGAAAWRLVPRPNFEPVLAFLHSDAFNDFQTWLGAGLASVILAVAAAYLIALLLGANVSRGIFWVLGAACGVVIPTIMRIFAEAAAPVHSSEAGQIPYLFGLPLWAGVAGLLAGLYFGGATGGITSKGRKAILIGLVLGAVLAVIMGIVAGGSSFLSEISHGNFPRTAVAIGGMAFVFACIGAFIGSKTRAGRGRTGKVGRVLPMALPLIAIIAGGGYYSWTQAATHALLQQAWDHADHQEWPEAEASLDQLTQFIEAHYLPRPVSSELDRRADEWNQKFPHLTQWHVKVTR